MESSEIDYEQQRARNMQRNLNFICALDIGPMLPRGDEGDIDVTSAQDMVFVEDMEDEFLTRCGEALVSCKKNYPFREKEALKIINYLETSDLTSAIPALLLYGPSGSGKTAVCSHILDHTKVLYTSILCTCYSDTLQVLQALWDGMRSAVGNHIMSSEKESSRWRAASQISRNRKISFVTLYDSIRDFMNNLALRRFVIMLDHVDCLELQDAEIAEKLLCMSELVHPGLKVIGLRRNLLGIDSSNKIALSFKPYTDAQITKIIERKINNIVEHTSISSTEEYLKRGTPPAGGKKKPLRPDQSAPEPDSAYPRNEQEVQMFREVLNNILPRLRMTTCHVADIMNISLLVWGLSRQQGDAINGDGAELLQARSSSDYAALTQSVLKMPFLRCDGNDNSRNDAVIDTESPAYLASKLARESDKYTFGDEKKGRRKRSRGGHDAQTADVPSSGPADASLLYAPRSFHLERLLTIFKHIYETNHRMDEEEADTTHTAAVFPIVKSHHSFADSGRMLMLDGDERFIAMINMLEHLNFITASASWREDQPAYYCAVDRDTIKIVSRSVHFPIENYITD